MHACASPTSAGSSRRSSPANQYLGAYRVFATSGASGFPGLFVYAHDEFAHWIAAGLARLARIGVTGETRFVAIGAPGDVHITRRLFAAFQSGRGGVPRLSATTPLDELRDALDEYRPEAIVAYAASSRSSPRSSSRGGSRSLRG